MTPAANVTVNWRGFHALYFTDSRISSPGTGEQVRGVFFIGMKR
jgi:hypothetical protein